MKSIFSDKRKLKIYIFFIIAFLGTAVLLFSDCDVCLKRVIGIFVIAVLAISMKKMLEFHYQINKISKFYELSQKLDDLKILQQEKPFPLILQTVLELGSFDWAVLFLMDFEKDIFEAVESEGIELHRFPPISFDEIHSAHSDNGIELTTHLLNYAFKKYDFKGAMAGSAIERNGVYYGCLLVGRHGENLNMTEKDIFQLNVLSDQISICMHNYRLHKELGISC